MLLLLNLLNDIFVYMMDMFVEFFGLEITLWNRKVVIVYSYIEEWDDAGGDIIK